MLPAFPASPPCDNRVGNAYPQKKRFLAISFPAENGIINKKSSLPTVFLFSPGHPWRADILLSRA
ncbi:MAG TPA: hypothetical protein DDY20_04995 [Desulfobulbaceae bacterium]|nr:hypothetical protein [Desulfobulbaceae bacterium]